MPVRHLIPFVQELPRMRALASLRAAQEISVGIGMDPAGRQGIHAAWKSDSRALVEKAKRIRRDPAMLAQLAKAAGVGFRRVVRPKGGAS